MINVLQGIALSVVGLAIVSTMGLVLLSQLQASNSVAHCSWFGTSYYNTTTGTCQNSTNDGQAYNYTAASSTAYTTITTLTSAISSLASWVGIIITLMICIYFIRVFSGGGAQTGGRVM